MAKHTIVALLVSYNISLLDFAAPHFSSLIHLRQRARHPSTTHYPSKTLCAMSNLVTVTSPEHFKEELSKDLNRVSVLNFWAPWAEPCKDFNKAVEEEAKRFPGVLFLNVRSSDGDCS